MAMVACHGAKAVAIGKGTTRVPEFELKGWKDKPEEAQPAPVQETTPEPQAAPQPDSSDDDWKF